MPAANPDTVPDLVIETYYRSDFGLALTVAGDSVDVSDWDFTFDIRAGARKEPGAITVEVRTTNARISCTTNTVTITVPGDLMTHDPGPYYAELVGFPPGYSLAEKGVFMGWAKINHHLTMIGES